MLWYAQSIGLERQEEYTYDLGMSEYLASFWNAEAVQKIRSQRDMDNDDRFASDEEFSEQLDRKDYLKSDELVQTIRDKYKHTNLQGNDRQRSRTVKTPEDMTGLFRLTKKR
jgi:hypothetical protein